MKSELSFNLNEYGNLGLNSRLKQGTSKVLGMYRSERF